MLYRRGKTWWLRFEHAGERQYFSTGETDRGAAEKKARKIRVDFDDRAGPGGRQAGVRLDALEALDLERVERKGLDGRALTIEELWRPLYRHLGGPGRDVTTMQTQEIAAYEGARRAEDVRGQTIRREVGALRRGMRLAVRDRVLYFDPIRWGELDEIESDPPNEAQASKEWNAVEIGRVLGKLSAKAKTAGIGDLCRFIQLTGLRLEEVRRFRATWIRGKMLHVPAIDGAKTGETGARSFPIGTEAMRLAAKRPKFKIGKPNKALALASSRAGFDRVLTPRDLRAWAITQAARVDLLGAQRLAGHTSIATTSRYLHAGKDAIKTAAQAIEAAAGRRHRGGDRRRRKAKKPRRSNARP